MDDPFRVSWGHDQSGVCKKKRYTSTRTRYNAKWSSLDRPAILGTIEGRFREARSPLWNRSFPSFFDRPPIDTISNIYVRWGTIEDDLIGQKI